MSNDADNGKKVLENYLQSALRVMDAFESKCIHFGYQSVVCSDLSPADLHAFHTFEMRTMQVTPQSALGGQHIVTFQPQHLMTLAYKIAAQ